MIGVVIVDDHEIVRRGLRLTISAETDMQLLGEAASGAEAVALLDKVQPKVLLMDIKMPDMDGIEAARLIHARYPAVVILMITSYNTDTQIYAAMQAGASGYLMKDVSGDELVQAIRRAARGEPQLAPDVARRLMQNMAQPRELLSELTARELEIFKLLGQGLSNREIAGRLFLTEATVKGYVSTLLDKLDVEDRTQAALLAVKNGLVNLDDVV